MQINSLYLNHKQLVDNEWDYDKNTLNPKTTAQFSSKEAYWKCCNGHSYKMRIDSRTHTGRGCPQCQQQYKKSKSLYTMYKDLVDTEWRFDLNNIDPNNVSAHSGKRAWWTCKTCGYTWECIIQNRTTDNSGCPSCAAKRKTSFPEQAIYFYVKQYFLDAINSYKQLGLEFDIYIPSIKTVIEYDGFMWHHNQQQQEIIKEKLCAKHNLCLIRIREEGLSNTHLTSLIIMTKLGNTALTDTILKLMRLLAPDINTDIDVARDSAKIYSQFHSYRIENSLAVCYPHLIQLFDVDKNDGLLPTAIPARSAQKVWWKCSKNPNHTWLASVHNMTRFSTSSNTLGCPYCSGKQVQEENSFAAAYPHRAIYWHPTLNNLKPTEVTPQSAKRVWALCPNGCVWTDKVYTLAIKKTCPVCKTQL